MKNRIGDSSTSDQLAKWRIFPIPVAAVGINRRRPESYRDQIIETLQSKPFTCHCGKLAIVQSYF
jgi:hypothetical protein